jgi:hypothetical protein
LWECTYTFGGGTVLKHGILAVWINSALPMSVSVGHGWHPAGRPMLVTRTTGTVVHELDGTPALEAYLAEVPLEIVREHAPGGAEYFRAVLENPVGLPNARGRYDVRQLHAYLPEGGGLNFNTGISEHSILQVMNSDDELLLDGAWQAANAALDQLDTPPRLALVFSCGSRVPLLGERVGEEARAISAAPGGASVCGRHRRLALGPTRPGHLGGADRLVYLEVGGQPDVRADHPCSAPVCNLRRRPTHDSRRAHQQHGFARPHTGSLDQ